jgi:hypothetical protein
MLKFCCESIVLVKFLFAEFNLTITIAVSTTKFHTTIDPVFSRFINKIISQTFILYFSYHKQIVSMIECDD